MKNDRKERNSDDFRDGSTETISSRKGSTNKSKNKRGSRNRSSNKSRSTDFRDTNTNNRSTSKPGIANDESWYSQSPEQVANSANVSFLGSLGKPIFGPGIDLSALSTSGNDLKFPSASGVMRIGYIPTFGNPQNPYDALNVGLQKTYADTRSKNSGSRVYYYPDFAKYLMVMDSAYAFAGTLMRAIGFLNSYSSMNKFLPKALFHAMGLDYDDLATQQPEFRLIVNNFISKLNTMNVPDTLPVFKRHFWLGSNVYADADVAWSQLYIHVPEVYAKYNYETADVDLIKLQNSGASIDPTKTVDNGLLTLTEIKDICDDITGNLLLSETFSIMSGDIFKAYGSALFKIEGVSEQFMLYPVYDAGVLNQIMNGTYLGLPCTKRENTNYVAADKGETIFSLIEDVDAGYIRLGYRYDIDTNPTKAPIFEISGGIPVSSNFIQKAVNSAHKLVNITSPNPTPIMVLESTRASSVYSINGVDQRILESCGADVYTTMRIYNMLIDPKTNNMTLNHTVDFVEFYIIPRANTSVNGFLTVFDICSKLAHFDWHPPMRILYDSNFGPNTAPAKWQLASPMVDVFNTALVSKEVLTNMHEVANMSLFDVTLRNYNNSKR